MKGRNYARYLKAPLLFLGMVLAMQTMAQSVPTTCPSIFKRSNGNGQAASCASVGAIPVAANVTGTPFETWLAGQGVLSSEKTGDINFRWAGSHTNLPVITRVWIGTTLSSTVVGPPPVPTYQNGYSYASYCFYRYNLPNQGVLTLEFADPATGLPFGVCSYSLGSNTATTTPAIPCEPIITAQPANVNQCAGAPAVFSVTATMGGSYEWQYHNGTSWVPVTGADFSGMNNDTLTVANPISYSGRQFRVVVGNSSCAGTTTSNTATLFAKPVPTAAFSTGGYLCGTGSRNLAVSFTGTAPWTLTYTATPDGGSASYTTISNITSSPYYLTVNPALSTSYQLTGVDDQTCSNNSLSGNTTLSIAATPGVSLTNASSCLGASSFSLAYTGLSAGASQYSITAGTRAAAGFSPVNNAVLSASPLTISIPAAGIPAGTYDFNLVLHNTTTGCSSSVIPFTLTVYAKPVLTASAASANVCSGTNVELTAAPSNLSSYSWTASPAESIAAVHNPTVTPLSATTYTVTGTDSRGCAGTANVSIGMLPAPVLSITPSSPTICSGSAALLTASGGNTYSWTPSTGLSATSGSTVVASPSATTTYTVSSASGSGCNATGQVTVAVDAPVISVSPSAATICAGASTGLTASGGLSYSWTPAAGLSATTGSSVTANPSATTTYYVTGTTASGCTGVATAAVTISAAPVNTATTTANTLIFCTQGTTSFPLNVNLTSATGISSMAWRYSTDGTNYNSFTSPATVSGTTMTSSSTGATNATLTLSNYGSSGYTGPRYFRLVITGSSCTFNYDIFITDTKSTSTTPAPAAIKTTVCTGDNTTLTIGSLASGSTAQWQSSPNNSTWTDIAGATAASYTTGALSSSTWYRVVYNGGNGNCGSTTTSLQITVAGSVASNTLAPATGCTDGTASYTITGSAISGASYQWQSSMDNNSFTDIIGASAQNYTIPGNLVTASTWFRRIAQAGNCASNTSTSVAVYAPIGNNQITTAPASFCATAGATALSATTPVGGNGTYSYQWESSADGNTFSPIAGATSSVYTTTSQAQTRWYRRTVNSGGCSSISSSIRLTVNANPTVVISPSLSAICNGSNSILTASGAASYTWTAGAGTLNAGTGAIVIATPNTTTLYTVSGTDTNGCSNTANQSITVNSLPSSPVLSGPGVTVCNPPNSAHALTVSSVPPGTTAFWYTVNETEPSGAYLISPANVNQSGTYYAYAKDNTTGCYSAAAAQTVSFIDILTPVPLATSITQCAPAAANLSSIEPAAAPGISYEWHTTASNPGAGTLVASPAAAGSGTYYLYGVTGNGCYSAASAPVTVTIHAQPSVSVSATVLSACTPGKIDLNADIGSPIVGYAYNWYTTNSNPGIADRVTDPSAVTAGGTYYLFAVDNNNCQSSASPAVTATLHTSPTVAIESPALVCSGAGASITVSATNANGYQWQYYNGSTWTDATGGVYGNPTTATLGISSATGLDGTLYRCIVSGNGGCDVTSDVVALAVESAVSIITATPDLSVCEGLDTVLSVEASVPAASYQWEISTNGGSSFSSLADNASYFGSQTPVLRIMGSTASLSGNKYRCGVTNSCSAATSAAITLSVNPIPGAPAAADVLYCLNATAAPLTAVPDGGNSLVWYTAPSGGSGSGTAPTPATASQGTAYYYVSQVTPQGCEGVRDTAEVTVSDEYVWIGNTSISWTTAANWECNAVPFPGANVRIVASPANQPQLQNDVTVGNLVFGSGSHISLNSKRLSISGQVTGSAVFQSDSAASIEFNGAATASYQFTGTGGNNIGNLTVNHSSAVITQAADTMVVHGTISPAAGILNFSGNNVRIRSTANYTARIAEAAGTLSGATNVTVERFVPSKPGRKWSSMASPVSALLSTSWQQDIFITGPGTGGTACSIYTANTQPGQYTNGFDATQTNNSSFFEYNNGAWQSIAGTNNTLLTPGKGYYVNVRGDRNVQGCQLLQYMSNQTGTTPTYEVTPRATGTLTQGNVNVTANTTSFNFLGNPYACEISFASFYAHNSSHILQKYWLYDPANINGNYMTWDGTNHAGAATGYTNHDVIASGQGFFVEVTGVVPAALTFREDQKTQSYQKGAFRTTTLGDKIRVNLFRSGDSLKQDDALIVFDQAGVVNNTTTIADSRSINAGEAWVATLKGSDKLSINKRQANFVHDTVDLFVYAAATGNYSFSFTDINMAGASIHLLDQLSGTLHNVTASPAYSFAVAAGGGITNRFQLVFNTTTLSSDEVALYGRLKGSQAVLTWNTGKGKGYESYLLQSSEDGRSFSELATVAAKDENKGASYEFTDPELLTGRKYYRVKAISKDGQGGFSNLVTLDPGGTDAGSFSMYPVPAGNELNIVLSGPDTEGMVRIYSAAGALVQQQEVSSALTRVNTSQLSKGVYLVEVSLTGGQKQTQKLIK